MDPAFRGQGVGRALLNHIATKFGEQLTVINVDEASAATTGFLEAMGLERFVSQEEMRLNV